MLSFLYLNFRHRGQSLGQVLNYEGEVHTTFFVLCVGFSSQRVSFFVRAKQPSTLFYPFTYHYNSYRFHCRYFSML